MKKTDRKPMIKERRMEKYLSQTELANKLNIDQGQLSRYENGKGYPSFDVLYDMEEILDCRLKDLYIKDE